MTDQATRIVPAGWYEDPASSAHVRWWNGLAWTEHTTLKPTTPPQPQAQPAWQTGTDAWGSRSPLDQYQGGTGAGAGAGQTGQVTTATGSIHTPETLARIAEARELERQYGISTAEHDIILRAATDGAQTDRAGVGDAGRGGDAVDTPRRYRRWDPDDDLYADERTGTASAWFLALWPVLTLVAAVTAGYVYFYVTPEPAIAGIPVIAALVLVPYLLTLVWAATDSRALRNRGHRPASAGLAVLGPLVYLIGRRARVAGSGPLVALLLLTLAAFGAPAAAYYTGAAAPVTKALEIQETIREDLVGSGRLASVACPPLYESMEPGTYYTCTGTTPAGGSRKVWVSFEDADGAFSYALSVR